MHARLTRFGALIVAAVWLLSACSGTTTDVASGSIDASSSATSAPAAAASNADVPPWGTCPTSVFPDLSGVAGAGEGYALPEVTVTCTDDEVVVGSNGMPGFTFVPLTPNGLAAQAYEWRIPLRPTVATEPTSIVDVLGSLGFTVTGLPIFGPTEGPVPPDQAFGDPVFNGILDDCGGHTGYAADYHNHALRDDAVCNLEDSRILGYALDGFPIYNAVGCLDTACTSTAVFHSGWVRTGDPTSYSWRAYTYDPAASEGGTVNVLDECNGRVGPDGTYRYHATTTFPYIIGCQMGTPTPQSGSAAAPMPPMGGGRRPPPPPTN